MDTIDEVKVQEILRIIESFRKDSTIYLAEGLSFSEILSERTNVFLSRISHTKYFIMAMYTDEPNLVFIIGAQDDNRIFIVCLENSYEKHKALIHTMFPNVTVTHIEDTSMFFQDMVKGDSEE